MLLRFSFLVVMKVEGFDHKLNLRAAKHVGYGHEFGEAHFAHGAPGDYNPWAEIYQTRRPGDKTFAIREKFYWPTNPDREAQQVWRATFREAVAAWQVLTKGKSTEFHAPRPWPRLSSQSWF